MKTIYHVKEQPHDRYVLDPALGPVLRHETIMKPVQNELIKYGSREYKVNDDGTFTVDDDCAAHLLAQPGWHEGANPFFIEELKAPEPQYRAPKVTKARQSAS